MFDSEVRVFVWQKCRAVGELNPGSTDCIRSGNELQMVFSDAIAALTLVAPARVYRWIN